ADPDDVASLAAAIKRFYEPGEPERLRAAVEAPDHGPLWDVYLATLTGAAGVTGATGTTGGGGDGTTGGATGGGAGADEAPGPATPGAAPGS
ncbi:hypothetical protein AB0J52_34870, partial [Spirillospora sp. NPDC049652]